jgi:hypothetical protein
MESGTAMAQDPVVLQKQSYKGLYKGGEKEADRRRGGRTILANGQA